jgi:hypothetical protein
MKASVAAFVEDALFEDPSLSSKELRQLASEIDRSVLQLSGRQFHAMYALQVRKKLTAAPTPRRSPSSRTTASDDAMNALLETYARKKTALDKALAKALDRAVAEDSLKRFGELLTRIESEIESLDKI